MEEDKLLVRKIENGTVIDHIPAGKGLEVIKILNIDLGHDEKAVVLVNVPSKKMGKKDVIKVENRQLSEQEVNRIALVAPNASLNIIKNWNVVEKQSIKLPKILVGVINCLNATCITNATEHMEKKFVVEKENPLKLRCFFCERIFGREEVA